MGRRLLDDAFEMPGAALMADRQALELGLRPRTVHAQRPLPLAPALRIRRATPLDLATCVRMAVRFAQEPPYGGLLPVNVGQLEVLVTFLFDHGGAFVAQLEDGEVVGMIGAHVTVHAIAGELVGNEVAWWVEPEHRGGSTALRLLAAAESWARDQGAVRFQMIAPAGASALRDLYRRRGYVEVETVFQRDLAA